MVRKEVVARRAGVHHRFEVIASNKDAQLAIVDARHLKWATVIVVAELAPGRRREVVRAENDCARSARRGPKREKRTVGRPGMGVFTGIDVDVDSNEFGMKGLTVDFRQVAKELASVDLLALPLVLLDASSESGASYL